MISFLYDTVLSLPFDKIAIFSIKNWPVFWSLATFLGMFPREVRFAEKKDREKIQREYSGFVKNGETFLIVGTTFCPRGQCRDRRFFSSSPSFSSSIFLFLKIFFIRWICAFFSYPSARACKSLIPNFSSPRQSRFSALSSSSEPLVYILYSRASLSLSLAR